MTTTQDNTDGGAKLATGRSMLRGSSIAMRDGPSAARPGKERDPLGSPLGLRNGEVQRSQLLSSCSELQRQALKLQREAERERDKEASALWMVQLEERLNEEFRFSGGLVIRRFARVQRRKSYRLHCLPYPYRLADAQAWQLFVGRKISVCRIEEI